MRKYFLIFILLVQGCAFHPFGTPVTKAENDQKKVVAAQSAVLGQTQTAVHETGEAIDLALLGNVRALPIAKDFNSTAETLIDQALGSPTAAQALKTRDLVNKLTSDNQALRTQAEKDKAKDDSTIVDLSSKLKDRTVQSDADQKKALTYADSLQTYKDWFWRAIWILGICLFLHFLGQLLAFAAHFNPAFGTASAAVNTIISPALVSLVHRAESKVKALLGHAPGSSDVASGATPVSAISTPAIPSPVVTSPVAVTIPS